MNAMKNKRNHTEICLPKFGFTPWTLRLRWGSLSYPTVNSKPGLFQPLSPFPLIDLFPYGGKIEPSQTIPWLTTTLVAHRATPSRLGGFTSKSNEWITSARRSPKCSRYRFSSLLLTHHKSLNPTQEFAILHSNLTKRGWGELKWLLKGFWNVGEPAATKRGCGGVFNHSPESSRYVTVENRSDRFLKPVRPVSATSTHQSTWQSPLLVKINTPNALPITSALLIIFLTQTWYQNHSGICKTGFTGFTNRSDRIWQTLHSSRVLASSLGFLLWLSTLTLSKGLVLHPSW